MRLYSLQYIAMFVLLSCCTNTPPVARHSAPSQSSEVSIHRDGELHGTFIRSRFPTVREPILIVAGSGPTDRNGNSPLGVAAAPYRMLAEAFEQEGISSLRFDKRGVAASGNALSREEDVNLDTYARDVNAWIDEAKRLSGANCVWVLGHSEGVLIGLLAAQENAQICGLILVSGMGRRAGDVIREQLQANPAAAPLLPDALTALAGLEAGRQVDISAMNPGLLSLFRPSIQPYMISLLAADPVVLLRAYRGPVLVMHGTTDLQTSVQDAQLLASARPGIHLALLEGVNHVLKLAPPDRALNGATYRDAGLALAPRVVEEIERFIRHRR